MAGHLVHCPTEVLPAMLLEPCGHGSHDALHVVVKNTEQSLSGAAGEASKLMNRYLPTLEHTVVVAPAATLLAHLTLEAKLPGYWPTQISKPLLVVSTETAWIDVICFKSTRHHETADDSVKLHRVSLARSAVDGSTVDDCAVTRPANVFFAVNVPVAQSSWITFPDAQQTDHGPADEGPPDRVPVGHIV